MKNLLLLVFLLCFTSAHSQTLNWAKSIGGIGDDDIRTMVQDHDKNFIIIGWHNDLCDFDPSAGEEIITTAGVLQSFVAKYTEKGELLWVYSFSATSQYIRDVAIDGDNNIWLMGLFSGTVDFDPGPDETTLTTASNEVYMLKLNAKGEFQLVFKIDKVDGYTKSEQLAADADGNVYLYGGIVRTVDFDPSADSAKITAIDVEDIFLAKYDQDGNFAWANLYGGEGLERVQDINVNPEGKVFISGNFGGEIIMDDEPYILTNPRFDGFLAKIDTDGELIWVDHIFSEGFLAIDISFGPQKSILVSGKFTENVAFNFMESALDSMYGMAETKAHNAYYGIYGPHGHVIRGGILSSSEKLSISAAFNDKNEIILAGTFAKDLGHNLDIPEGKTFWNDADGDFYIVRLNTDYELLCARQFGDNSNTTDHSIEAVFAKGNNMLISGTYSGTLSADPESNNSEYESAGGTDMFFGAYDFCDNGLGSTSITENEFLKLAAYPNPTNGLVQFDLNYAENAIITISDVHGQNVEFVRIDNNTIDLSTVANGIYFCTLTVDNTVQSIRIIKQ